MIKLTFNEFFAVLEKNFGEDPLKWEFVCPMCGHIQSGEKIYERNKDIPRGTVADWIFQECEGRHTKGVGCDWALYGLLRIHKLEVDKNGKSIPCFMPNCQI